MKNSVIRRIMRGAVIGIMACSMAFYTTACGADSDADSKRETSGNLEDQIAEPEEGDTIVTLHVKSYGDIKLRFFEDATPKAVENFVTHAKEGYFDGITFHRVIDDFMIQGGDPTGTGRGGESIWGEQFENECVDYLMPIRGALCMASAGADTNRSQFFIVQCKEAVTDSSSTVGLSEEQIEFFEENGGCPYLAGMYTVFGQVIEGMDVVDAIAKTKTGTGDKPVKDVVIESAEVSEY